ncbi:hypothetical protein HDU96_001142 [Phlyctochytrium bullatum]|nr:hypothetical protein HDU96_001142 [Phlyctochytrium bullatum]
MTILDGAEVPESGGIVADEPDHSTTTDLAVPDDDDDFGDFGEVEENVPPPQTQDHDISQAASQPIPTVTYSEEELLLSTRLTLEEIPSLLEEPDEDPEASSGTANPSATEKAASRVDVPNAAYANEEW